MQQLYSVLLTTPFFQSNRQLRALFVDERLRPFQNRLPDADTPAARVEQLISFLDKKLTTDGEPALVVFLRVCASHLDSGDALQRQLLALAQALAKQAEVGGENPYLGLLPFSEGDVNRFYGRDRVVSQLVTRTAEKPALMTVLGPSGSGKSSVVYAGVIPALRAAGGWRVLALRPGRDPMRNLAAALVDALEDSLTRTLRLIEINRMTNALVEGQITLDEVLHDLSDEVGVEHLLLVVDQFEELFSLTQQESQQDFLEAFLAEELPATRLLTMRADFLGHALANKVFADALQGTSFMLGPMSREELHQAIEEPALQAGARFDEGLVDRILDNLESAPGQLPLLQFALTELWKRQTLGVLTHSAYKALGGVSGALTKYADDVYSQLAREQQVQARHLFAQLIRPGVVTEDASRVTSRRELSHAQWEVAQILADARLVVTGQDPAGEETVEVVHEALIQSWERLVSWMAQDRSFRAWQEQTRVLQEYWLTNDRDSGILLRGRHLAEAEGWFQERGDELSSAERPFVEASLIERHKQQEELLDLQELRVKTEIHIKMLTEERAIIGKVLSELKANRERHASALAELKRLEREQPRLRDEMGALQERLQGLEVYESVCPLCGETLSHPNRGTILEEIRMEGTAKGERFRDNKRRLAALSEEVAQLTAEIQQGSLLERKAVDLDVKIAEQTAALNEVERNLDELE